MGEWEGEEGERGRGRERMGVEEKRERGKSGEKQIQK